MPLLCIKNTMLPIIAKNLLRDAMFFREVMSTSNRYEIKSQRPEERKTNKLKLNYIFSRRKIYMQNSWKSLVCYSKYVTAIVHIFCECLIYKHKKSHILEKGVFLPFGRLFLNKLKYEINSSQSAHSVVIYQQEVFAVIWTGEETHSLGIVDDCIYIAAVMFSITPIIIIVIATAILFHFYVWCLA